MPIHILYQFFFFFGLYCYNWVICLSCYKNFTYSGYFTHSGSLSGIWFANIFSHRVGFFFHFLDSVLKNTKFLNFDEIYNLYMFYFVAHVLDVISQKPLPTSRLEKFTHRFSSKSFIVSPLTFRSLIYFEFFNMIRDRRPTLLFSR